jgi:hypothetical protein
MTILIWFVFALFVVVCVFEPVAGILAGFGVLFSGPFVYPILKSVAPFASFWIPVTLAFLFCLWLVIYETGQRLKLPGVWRLAALALLAGWTGIYDSRIGLTTVHGLSVPMAAGFCMLLPLERSRHRHIVIAAVTVVFLSLLAVTVQVAPFLLDFERPDLGGGLRMFFAGNDPALLQATTLAWIFNAGALLSLGMTCRWRGIMQVVFAALFLVFAAASILTFSRGTYLGLIAGIAGVALVFVHDARRMGKLRRTLLLWAACGAVLACVAYFSGAWEFAVVFKSLEREMSLAASNTGRLYMLSQGLSSLSGHLLTGTGLGGTPSHSSLLDAAIDYGVPLAVALWALLICLMVRSYRLARKLGYENRPEDRFESSVVLGTWAALAGGLVQALLDPVFFALHFSALFWLLRGIESCIANAVSRRNPTATVTTPAPLESVADTA